MSLDGYALTYDQALSRGVSLSGEAPEWFARQRLLIVKAYLEQHSRRPQNILEFGCGTGNHIPLFRRTFEPNRIIGVDISRPSLRVAQIRHGAEDLTLTHPWEFDQPGTMDLIYVNGVFHHIPAVEHEGWLQFLMRALAPGGMLALFDNNPYSLAARLVMRLIPFDRDAVMVNPYRFKRLIHNTGFDATELSFHFLFPRCLRPLRRVEPMLQKLPLGAQYVLFASKRGGSSISSAMLPV